LRVIPGLPARHARLYDEQLAPTKRSLKMLDCYRPVRAVHDMVVWARNGRETPAERRYNPAFSKKDLFRLGYVAEHSGHSTGVAVDLTLVDLTAGNSAAYDPDKAYCTAPARQGFVNYSKEWWRFFAARGGRACV
jgi:zinc D-Ala-D-Ala dipeptidase